MRLHWCNAIHCWQISESTSIQHQRFAFAPLFEPFIVAWTFLKIKRYFRIENKARIYITIHKKLTELFCWNWEKNRSSTEFATEGIWLTRTMTLVKAKDPKYNFHIRGSSLTMEFCEEHVISNFRFPLIELITAPRPFSKRSDRSPKSYQLSLDTRDLIEKGLQF